MTDAQRLRNERKTRNLSQAQAATLLGVGRRTYVRYESLIKPRITFAAALRIKQVMGIEVKPTRRTPHLDKDANPYQLITRVLPTDREHVLQYALQEGISIQEAVRQAIRRLPLQP